MARHKGTGPEMVQISFVLEGDDYDMCKLIAEQLGIPMSAIARRCMHVLIPAWLSVVKSFSKLAEKASTDIEADLISALGPDERMSIINECKGIRQRVNARADESIKEIKEIRDRANKAPEILGGDELTEALGLAEEHAAEQLAIEAVIPKDPPLFDEDGILSDATPEEKRELMGDDGAPLPVVVVKKTDANDVMDLLDLDI